MSLITLRSSQQDNGANVSQSASNFTNHFKEGIVLGPGNTIELVSMSIIKYQRYEVIQGQNDTFIWRIGAGPSSLGGTPTYSQHVVTLVPGSYNGADLARHIQEQLNSSTLLGVYEGTWTCGYTPEADGKHAKFTINYGQNATPTNNADETGWVQNYGWGAYNITPDAGDHDSKLRFTQFVQMGQQQLNSLSFGFRSIRGLFSNGGRNEVTIKPVQLVDEITTLTSQENKILNWNQTPGFDVKAEFTTATGTPATNGWEYKVVDYSGQDGAISTFDLQGTLGVITALHTFSGGSGYVVGDTGTLDAQPPSAGLGATYTVTSISGGGGVTGVTITSGGHGFQVNDDLQLTPGGSQPGTGSGTTAKVQTVSVGDDGTGYSVGNTGSFTGGSGTDADYEVTSVGAGGSVTGITLTDKGISYELNDILTLAGSGNGDAKIKVTAIERKSFTRYAVSDSFGNLGIGSNGQLDATDKANWTVGTFILNGNTPAPAYHRMSQSKLGDGSPGGIMELETSVGGGFQFTTKGTYTTTKIGYARNQLVTGDFGNPNEVYTKDNDGFDVNISIKADTGDNTASNICFNVYQIQKQPGVNYPNAGWRATKIICQDLDPEDWNSMPRTPADWASFTFGEDNIRVRAEIVGNTTILLYASHDTQGDGTFIEEVNWLKTGDKANQSGGKMDNDFNSTIREILYPLHGVVFTSPGTPFTKNEIDLGGVYDTKLITQDGKDLRSTGGSQPTSVDVHEEVDLTVEESLQANPLTLGAIYKMGLLTGTDIHNGPPSGAGANQISTFSVNPNIGNMAPVLGLANGYTFQAGQQSNPIETADGVRPLETLNEPTLHVELPDFNIKSWSGESSDTGRAVAVIPKEQWTTDQQTGILHYMSQYPQPIDLNLPSTKPFYELSCRLRSPDGKLADDLINPTEVCLKIGETEESRQSKVMMKAMDRLGMIIGNRQDTAISTMTEGLPLI